MLREAHALLDAARQALASLPSSSSFNPVLLTTAPPTPIHTTASRRTTQAESRRAGH
jgi:hypothetical protein